MEVFHAKMHSRLTENGVRQVTMVAIESEATSVVFQGATALDDFARSLVEAESEYADALIACYADGCMAFHMDLLRRQLHRRGCRRVRSERNHHGDIIRIHLTQSITLLLI